MADIVAAKAEVRAQGFAQRKAAFEAVAQTPATDRLLDHVLSFVGVQIVSAYMSMRTEISPTPVMLELVERGIDVAVPVIVGAGEPLLFARWTPETAMVAGEFGAEIPEQIDALRPELVITPMVAFDEAGHRLGYGGGFYDRSLAELQAEGRGVPIGFAFEGQCVDEVPIEPTDIRLHSIVTEARIRIFD